MSQDYRQARDATSRVKYDRLLYDKAVFASDKSLRSTINVSSLIL